MDNSADSLDDTILTDEALSLMKKKLPNYVVNSLIATGYDTLEVIAELTSKDLTEIEMIINNDFVGDDRFVNQAVGNSSGMSLFKFQPGHRKRIELFIEEAKSLVKEKKSQAKEDTKHKGQKRKSSQPFYHRCKKAKSDHEEVRNGEITDGHEGSSCSELDLLKDFRQNFVKWQRHQQVQRYKEIRENKDFSLKISISSDQSVSAILNCSMCGKRLSLGVKSNSILLSIWTCHINFCKGISKTNTLKTTTLNSFFTRKATITSCSKSMPSSVSITKSVTHDQKCKCCLFGYTLQLYNI